MSQGIPEREPSRVRDLTLGYPGATSVMYHTEVPSPVAKLWGNTKVGKLTDAAVAYTPALSGGLSRAYFTAKKLVKTVTPKGQEVVKKPVADLPPVPALELQKKANQGLQYPAMPETPTPRPSLSLAKTLHTAASSALGKYRSNQEDSKKWLGLKGLLPGKDPYEGVGVAAIRSLTTSNLPRPLNLNQNAQRPLQG